MQRALDILFSGLALIVLAPLMLLIMLGLRLTGEGEVFFRQQRVGQGGKPFALLKFATMLKDSPSLGTGTVTLKDDPRILPMGKFLRKTKLNELPQLINIVKGDMSVIGPRPQTQRCFDAFPLQSQQAIVQVKPGLSGIGSVVFRGEEDMLDINQDPGQFYDQVIMPYKGELEEWYEANQSVRLYFALIVLTLLVVIFPNVVYPWRFFPDLPIPPDVLKSYLKFSSP